MAGWGQKEPFAHDGGMPEKDRESPNERGTGPPIGTTRLAVEVEGLRTLSDVRAHDLRAGLLQSPANSGLGTPSNRHFRVIRQTDLFIRRLGFDDFAAIPVNSRFC
jgi:hypothetical protein